MAEVKRIILWRHGQTDYNVNRRIQGQVDIPLNAEGIAQASAAATVLAGHRIHTIVSSNLERAQQTAEQLRLLTGVEIEIDSRLRERSFGCWEGLNAQELEQQWPGEYARWRNGLDPVGVDVEPRNDVGNRVAQAVFDAVAVAQARSDVETPGDTIVIVSHGSALTMGVVRVLGLQPAEFFGFRGMDNCHWAELVPSVRGTGYLLWAYNRGMPGVQVLR